MAENTVNSGAAFSASSDSYDMMLDEIIARNKALNSELSKVASSLEMQNRLYTQLGKNSIKYYDALKLLESTYNRLHASRPVELVSEAELKRLTSAKNAIQELGMAGSSSSGALRVGPQNLINTVRSTQGSTNTASPEIVRTTAEFASSLRGVVSQLQSSYSTGRSMNIQSGASTAGATASGSSSIMGINTQTLATLGKTTAVVGAVVTVVMKLVDVLKKMNSAGLEAYKRNLELQRSATVLGGGFDTAVSSAEKLNDVLGLNLQNTLSAMAEVSGKLTSLGASDTGAAAYASQINEIALAITNAGFADFETALEDTKSSIIDGTPALSKYAIQAGRAADETYAMITKGLVPGTYALTELGEIERAVANVTQQLSENFAGLSTVQDPLNIKIQKMKNQWQDITLQLKDIFIPVMAQLTDILSSFVGTVHKLLSDMGLIKDSASLEMVKAANREKLASNSATQSLTKQIQSTRELAEAQKAANAQLYKFDEVIQHQAQMTSKDIDWGMGDLDSMGLNIGGETVIDVTPDFTDFQKQVMSLPDLQEKLNISDTAEELEQMWDTLSFPEKVELGLGTFVKGLQNGADAGFLLKTGLFGVLDIISPLEGISGLIEGISLMIQGDWVGGLKKVVGGVWDISAALTAVINPGQALFMGFIEGIYKANEEKLSEFVDNFFQGIVDIGTFFEEQFGESFEWLKTAFSGAWTLIKGIFTADSKLIGDGITSLFEGLVNSITSFVGASFSVIEAAITGIKDFFSTISDWVVRVIDAIKGVDWGNIWGKFSLSTSTELSETTSKGKSMLSSVGIKLPSYDSGGIAISPHIAQIGTSNGEIAVPLRTAAADYFYSQVADGISNNLSSNQGTSGGDITVNIKTGTVVDVNRDFKHLANLVGAELSRQLRDRGALNYGIR